MNRILSVMKRLLVTATIMFTVTLTMSCGEKTGPETPANETEKPERPDDDRKILVAYFSATGNTHAVAQSIAAFTGADIYRIQPSEPYADNPYDDSDMIKDEAYNDRRPAVSNLPASVSQYDVIFVGSPIWWHYPAMVVCTFLEAYDLSGKIIVPFFTYGATTYLQQSIDKIHEVTPNSAHLETFGSTGSTSEVEDWLKRIEIME